MYDELVKMLRTCSERDSCIGWKEACPYLGTGVCDNKAEKAADAIEELKQQVEHYHGCMNDWFETAQEYKDEMPRWIPVEERLPETPGEYMVVYHPCYWDRVHDEIKVGLDSFRGKTSWAKKKYQRVTHWMPLPGPPKEE